MTKEGEIQGMRVMSYTFWKSYTRRYAFRRMTYHEPSDNIK